MKHDALPHRSPIHPTAWNSDSRKLRRLCNDGIMRVVERVSPLEKRVGKEEIGYTLHDHVPHPTGGGRRSDEETEVQLG